MKDPLVKLNIVISGDFGEKRSHENLKRWIENNGGKVTSINSTTVTHLICSKEHWKMQHPMVKAAMKQKDVKIVSYDWLEDSLLAKYHKRETPYLWTTLSKVEATKKAQKKAVVAKIVKKEVVGKTNNIPHDEVKKFRNGCKEAIKDIHSENHHLYRDATSFLYNIALIRPDIARNRNERHQLRIYENNHGPPNLYATTTTYTLPGRAPLTWILAPTGSQFHVAYLKFKQFFKCQTGIDWDFRLWGRQEPSAGLAPPRGEKFELYRVGENTPVEGANRDKFFTYLLPDRDEGEALGEMGMGAEGVRRFGRPPVLEMVGGGNAKEEVEDDDDDD